MGESQPSKGEGMLEAWELKCRDLEAGTGMVLSRNRKQTLRHLEPADQVRGLVGLASSLQTVQYPASALGQLDPDGLEALD